MTTDSPPVQNAPKSLAPVDNTVQAVLQPNLTRDLAGVMTLLFIFIAYHIQHPTLLLRSQFGRSFRGESLQDAIAVGLLLSGGLLVWQVFANKRESGLRPWQWGFAIGLGLFTLHVLLMLPFSRYLLLDAYDLNLEDLERPFREDTFVNPVKALNLMAMFAGGALASIVFLWSPWHQRQSLPQRSILTMIGILAIIGAFLGSHPLAELRGGLWADLNGSELQIVLALVIMAAGAGLIFLQPQSAPTARRLVMAMVGVVALYGLYILLIATIEENLIASFYNVQTDAFASLFVDPALKDPMLAFDWASLLAGVAAVSVLFLVMPWNRLNLYARVTRRNIVPALIAIFAVAAWETAVNTFEIEEFLLPKPSVIWTEFKDIYPRLIAAGWLTFQNALFGFLVGVSAGILSGVISARFARFSRAILPLAIAANSVPIIAFAPIANLWFGVASITSKIAIVAVLCYFPAMISTVRGLLATDPREIELMHSYAATEFEILRKVRVPVALPYILSALKLSTTLAMIGAIVAEFFGGSFSGLGYLIRNDAVLFRFPASWSAIVVASLFGISFYLLITALERVLMPWYQSFREESR